MPSLDQLRRGERARVEAVRGDDAVVQRLLEMGLLEGEEVEVLGFAPLGDPLEIRLRDFRLSLRRSEAARVLVHPIAEGGLPRAD
jgi:ferrous iron transport protein A